MHVDVFRLHYNNSIVRCCQAYRASQAIRKIPLCPARNSASKDVESLPGDEKEPATIVFYFRYDL